MAHNATSAFTITLTKQISITKDIHRLIQAQHQDQWPRVIIFGEPPTGTIEQLETIADVAVLQPTAAPEIGQADLAICWDLSSQSSDVDATDYVDRITSVAGEVVVALPWLPMEISWHNHEFAEWLSLFIDVGFVPDLAVSSVLSLNSIIYLRRTQLSASRIASTLTLHGISQHEQLMALYLSSKHTDNLLASVTRQMQRSDISPDHSQQRLILLEQELQTVSNEWNRLRGTPGYAILTNLQRARARLTPPGSRRERLLEMLLGWLRILSNTGLHGLATHFRGEVRWRGQSISARFDNRKHYENRLIKIKPFARPPAVQPHTATVDVVICIHNELEDIKHCLKSV